MCDCLRIKFFWHIFHKEQTVPFHKSMVKAAFYSGHMYDAFTTLYYTDTLRKLTDKGIIEVISCDGFNLNFNLRCLFTSLLHRYSTSSV